MTDAAEPRTPYDTDEERAARMLPVTDAAGKHHLTGEATDWIEFETALKIALIEAQRDALVRYLERGKVE